MLRSATWWINALHDLDGLNAVGQAWHVLRHTYSRIFLESGGRLEELQKSLGHSAIQTTESYNGHFSEDSAVKPARQHICPAVSAGSSGQRRNENRYPFRHSRRVSRCAATPGNCGRQLTTSRSAPPSPTTRLGAWGSLVPISSEIRHKIRHNAAGRR